MTKNCRSQHQRTHVHQGPHRRSGSSVQLTKHRHPEFQRRCPNLLIIKRTGGRFTRSGSDPKKGGDARRANSRSMDISTCCIRIMSAAPYKTNRKTSWHSVSVAIPNSRAPNIGTLRAQVTTSISSRCMVKNGKCSIMNIRFKPNILYYGDCLNIIADFPITVSTRFALIHPLIAAN